MNRITCKSRRSELKPVNPQSYVALLRERSLGSSAATTAGSARVVPVSPGGCPAGQGKVRRFPPRIGFPVESSILNRNCDGFLPIAEGKSRLTLLQEIRRWQPHLRREHREHREHREQSMLPFRCRNSPIPGLFGFAGSRPEPRSASCTRSAWRTPMSPGPAI